MLAHPRRTLPLLLTSLLATAALAACGNDGDDSLPPPADPPTTSDQPVETISLTPEEEQAVEEAKAKFDEFMNAYVEEATTGEPFDTPAGPVLAGGTLQHLEGDLYSEIHGEFLDRFENGQVTAGELRWGFDRVQEVDLDRVIENEHLPAVWLVYCIDQSDWQTVNVATGAEVDAPGNREFVVIRAIRVEDGENTGSPDWRIAEREWTGQPC